MRPIALSKKAPLFLPALWLWGEALLRWTAPVLALALCIAALALWGVFEKFSPFARWCLSIGFWLCSAGLLFREFSRVPWPNAARIQSRMEKAGRLDHQPLQTLSDAPMRRNPLSDALWQHHQMHAAGLLSQLRWPRLRTDYAARDPFALRYLFLIVAGIGALYAPDHAAGRLASPFVPGQSGLRVMTPGEFYLYFTPPEYAALKPVFLSRQNVPRDGLTLPAGTRLWARVSGGVVKPVMQVGEDEKKLTRVQDGFFVLQTDLQQSGDLKIHQGIFPLLNLHITVQHPVPPEVSVQSIIPQSQGVMRVLWCASDRYGLQNVTFHWQAGTAVGEHPLSLSGRRHCDTTVLDVSADSLAGYPVAFWSVAKNTAGLEGHSTRQDLTLPHYALENPWAARLAAARQDYALNDNAAGLRAVLSELRNQKLSSGLYLAIQSSQAQLLMRDKSLDASLLANLWQIVMRIEEGEYADIAANWRSARDELLSSLRDWRMSETALIQRLARAQAAWEDYAPAMTVDPAEYVQFWDELEKDIASAQRPLAIRSLTQLDNNPALVLQPPPRMTNAKDAAGERELNENDAKENSIKENAARAMAQIRAGLMDATLSPDARDYLENLIQSVTAP